MATGQRTFEVFCIVNSGEEATNTPFCDDGRFDCNFVMPVFADSSGDDLRNDKSSYLVPAQEWVSNITFTLQKNEANVWVDKSVIIDDTYGLYSPQGSFESKPKYAQFLICWTDVLPAFGAGEYRLKIVQETPLGDQESFSKSWCLKEYNCTSDNTVRIEWFNNNGLGDILNDRDIIDFADINLYNQVRIPKSFFGYPDSEYDTNDIQYNNGQFEDVTNVQTETYLLKIGAIPMWLHRILKTYAMQSGTVRITDYSSNNLEEYIQKEMRLTSTYSPRYKTTHKCAPVTLEMQPTYNRLEKFRCI